MTVGNIEVCNSHAVNAYEYINLNGHGCDKNRLDKKWLLTLLLNGVCRYGIIFYLMHFLSFFVQS